MDHERNQEEMTDANGQTEVHTRPDENTMEIRQTRTLSSKMQEEYENEVAKHVNKLTKINGLIEEVIAAYRQSDNPTEELLIKMRDDLQKYLEKFERRVNEFFQYLERTKTSESSVDLAAQKVSAAAVIQKTRTCQANINASLQSKTEIDKKSITSNKEVKTEKAISKRSKENSETKSDKKSVVAKQEVKTDKAVSVHSRVKSKSNRSSSSLAKQRMKTEAARCKLEFAEMEAKLKLEKIRIEEEETRLSNQKKELEVNMDLLTVQRAVKEAEIEYDVMLEEMSDDNSSHGSNKSSVASKDVYERTKDYVSQQNDMYPLQQSMPYQMTEIPSNKHYTEQHFQTDSRQPQTSVVASNNDSASIASEMAKIIMKKDILMSRLTLFTDKVEHYLIWKTKFRSIMRDLNVTPQEELDLLVRWLGPESSRHALGLQAANAHDPSKGLERVWSRLDERYGSPELIEMTVKEKLSKFQRIGNTDQKKLYELSDILAEIVAIKENPKYGTLFSYFDSSAGVNPIVSKLPGFMQNKWTDRASKYKAERRCVYPPFIEFANFINEMSIRMNDPSFNYDLSPTHRNTSLGRPRINNLVTARKTEIASTNHDSRRYIRCPLHTQSNHSLNECRSFRTLTIEDRKALIAQNGICFKCCKEKHLARDCRLDTRCGICMMRGHPDALHVDRPSNPRSFQGANRYQSTRNMNAPTGRENQQSRSKPLESQGGERVSGATSQIRQDATQVMEAEMEKRRSEDQHLKMTTRCGQIEQRLHLLERTKKRAIGNARCYFELKNQLDLKLQQQKQNVTDLQCAIKQAKAKYSKSLRKLEEISLAIHEARRNKLLLMYPRQPGVGAECDSLCSSLSEITLGSLGNDSNSIESDINYIDTDDEEEDFIDNEQVDNENDRIGEKLETANKPEFLIGNNFHEDADSSAGSVCSFVIQEETIRNDDKTLVNEDLHDYYGEQTDNSSSVNN